MIITRLTDASATVFERSAEQLRQLELERIGIRRIADERIEREQERLASEHSEAMAAIAARERKLAEDTEGLDDRSNTHVRRELQREMAGLSEDTLRAQLLGRSQLAFFIPLGLTLLALVALGWLILAEVANLNILSGGILKTITSELIKDAQKPGLVAATNQAIIFEQLRIVLQTVGGGLLVWFGLRLANNRYRQISRWEHDLHKFRLDTERASFLIEGELEARRMNGGLLPEVVLDRFSRGLFTSEGDDRRSDADEVSTTLGHLLSRAASVKIGTDGVSVEVDKSGIKKARKDSKLDGDAE